ADIRYPQSASHPGTIHCSAGGVGRNIAHNLALLGRDVHLLSVIRGMADIRYPQSASHPGTIHCSAGGVGRNIAHNLALLGRDVH
ncbi:PfkB family carbohydrate kinase, partial [Escherichia coli]